MKTILVLSILVFSSYSLADDASDPLAKRLYIALDQQDNAAAIAENMGQILTTQIGSDEIPEEARSFVEKKYSELFTTINDTVQSEDMQHQHIKAIAETYSTEELASAVKFFESPTGKAYTAKLPQLHELQLEMVQSQMAALTETTMKIMEEISAEIRKYK